MHMRRIVVGAFCLSQAACMTTPAPYDLPYNRNGTPLVNSIVRRINCELALMVREDRVPRYRRWQTLLRYDYRAAMLLTIDSNETGAIAPVFNFPHTGFAFSVAPSYKHSREDQMGYFLSFSFVDILEDLRDNPDKYECPSRDTDLAGDLGLEETVSSALNLEELTYTDKVTPTGGVFNGFVTFSATKSIDRIGPTWTLTHFNGPGPLLSGSIATTNKLAFGFAGGPLANKGRARLAANKVVTTARADQALGQALANDANTQLTAIRNLLR